MAGGAPIPIDLEGRQSRKRHREVVQQIMLSLASVVLQLEVRQPEYVAATEDGQHVRRVQDRILVPVMVANGAVQE